MKQAFFADYIYYNHEIHSDSWLLTENDIIRGITSDIRNLGDYHKKRFNNSAIFPGLINTHCHLGMGIFRGIADDIPLMKWLNEYIWPAEKKLITSEFVYKSTLLSLAESIRSGVTYINDMYFFPLEGKRAFEKAGMRGNIGFGVFDSYKKALEAADHFEASELVTHSICPHALYTVSFDTMKACAEYALKHDVLLHTHLAETLDESSIIMEKYGKTPVEAMYETGAFDCRSIFAHCVHVNENDMDIMSRNKANISHCIESNMKLASGFTPIKKMADAGINITIGTDGAASNNDLSMIGEMSSAAKIHKALNMDAAVFSAADILEMATGCAAKALNKNIGNLNIGMKADFFVVSFDAVHTTPVFNPLSHLIYSAKDSDITHVYINGRTVMENGKILTFDEEEIKEYARYTAKLI